MADLVKVYTKDDVDKFSLEELEKTIKTLENVRRSQGPYVSQPNYDTTMANIKKALGKPNAFDDEVDLYVKQRIADIKNDNTSQKVKGAIQAVKNTEQKLSGPAAQTVKPVYDNNKKTELTGGRFVPEQEQPKYNDDDRQITMQTGGRVTKAPETVKQETGYKTNAELDKEASLGHNVSGPLSQANSNKAGTNAVAGPQNSAKGGNKKSSDTGMAGNMTVPKAGGFGEQAGDQTSNYLVNSVGENKGYNQAAQLANQRAATAAAELIGGNSSINANKKGPNETLRLSRLAEALNAREWTPGYRGQVASINQQAGGADVRGYRKAPIETAEMRQQQRTEGYEQNARNLDYNILKIQQQYNAMKAANIDDAVINAFLQTQMAGINQMYAQNMYNWQQQTDLNFAKQKARTVADINRSNPEVAAYLAYILGAGYTQDLLTADYDNAKAKIIADKNLTEEQRELALRTLAAGYLNLSIQPILGGAGAASGAFKQLPDAIRGGN